MTQYDMLPQTKESLLHVLNHYEKYKKDGFNNKPMVVGVSGCQGSGKTTLCDTLSHLLRQEPYNLNVVNFSLDDLYLTHKEQLKLSEKYSNNPLYEQRGQAGSHDLKLAKEIFEKLIDNKGNILIPVYDKSLNNGQGDRLNEFDWKKVSTPIDIILFEGWMLGFKSLKEIKQEKFEFTNRISINDAKIMNELLLQYEKELYPYFDIFIHLSPIKLNQVYQWRLQQEQHMKSYRGVQGLSDKQVQLFVETYMPAYELYLPKLDSVGFYGKSDPIKSYEGLNRLDHGYSQSNRHLRILLDNDRKVIQSKTILEESNSIITKSNLFKKPTLFYYKVAFMGVIFLGFLGYKQRSTFFKRWN